ncbi:MAG: glucosidase [Dermatophilaceae bacterium]
MAKTSSKAARTAEHARLAESPDDSDPWRQWGPYVSARQWGTVREDYSADGDAWGSFPFDHAHQRAYRWGEDGLAGLCDRWGFLNLGIALWNGQDDRLKERLFGLTNPQGNHGEDAKEYWWHLDATPTHSYAAWLYRYPQRAYPYADLVATNAARSRDEDEYELSDTGVLAEDRFFDVVVTHAKASPDDMCIRIDATNHGPDPAPLDLIPQLWFRNTWRWGRDDRVPTLRVMAGRDLDDSDLVGVEAKHDYLGTYRLFAEGRPEVMFCDNETNEVALWGAQTNPTAYPKDGINRAIVDGDRSGLNGAMQGTKVALRYHVDAVPPGETVTINLRLRAGAVPDRPFGKAFRATLRERKAEADAFYDIVIPQGISPDGRHVARRAFAGLLWGKQLYRYNVAQWLDGDPETPPPPASRRAPEPFGRNTSWRHLALADVISMPDEWEYPWFASWDLAFHCVALAHVDPAFAKDQLRLICREWAQHPSGQLPAYEWAFSDVNPPVHAWAAWQVYQLDGEWDVDFLIRITTKLLLNLGWWVNRKDADDSNLFEGGFLGMDNIGVFDRSHGVPAGWRLEQSDATSWVAFHCLTMLRMALELSRRDTAWDDLATTFLERFLAISTAIETFGTDSVSLWDEEDGFYYDILLPLTSDDVFSDSRRLRVRSLVGLLPLLAVGVVPAWVTRELPDFMERFRWLQRNRPEEADAVLQTAGPSGPATLMLIDPARHTKLVERMLDESEFLGPYGIRSLSAVYRGGAHIELPDGFVEIEYVPGESNSPMFGGNSNWRGPVWFPVNVLLADALRAYAAGAGASVRVEFPTGSGELLGLGEVADRLEQRLLDLFRPGPDGRRPSGPRDVLTGPLWDEHPVFSEYFHGDTGRGLGASHQTGWTALVAHLICQQGAGVSTVPD